MAKRLPGYDYSQPGFYFVTICVEQHRMAFGTILDNEVYLKEPGEIAQSVWLTLPKRFAHVKLHEYIFMPNHMHAILELTELDSTSSGPRAALWEIIRLFKAATSYQVRRSKGHPWFAWQDDYYDEIISNETALQHIRRYIYENPLRWGQDEFYRRY